MRRTQTQTVSQPAAQPTAQPVAAPQQPHPATTVTTPTPSLANKAGGSILSRLHRITTQETQPATAPTTATPTQPAERKPIDMTQLMAAWNEFSASLPPAENYLKNIMAKEPRCSGSVIMLDIITPSQAVISENEALISFLRGRLGDPTIVIRTNLIQTEEQSTSTPFTSKQKLEVMLGENKSLKNMIERYGLSFDF